MEYGNWVDLFFVVVVIYFMLTSNGLIAVTIETVSFVISLIAAYRFYEFFGSLISQYFTIPEGISQALGFFSAWFLFELLISLAATFLTYKYLRKYIIHPVNYALGYVVGAFRGMLLFLFFISLAFALPVRGQVKQAILDSRTGPVFVGASQLVEGQIKGVFNDAILESLNFLTVRPDSSSSYDLGFEAQERTLTEDPASEATMLNLVNKERRAQGLSTLELDPRLTEVGRAYAREMFENGFFSHTSQVDGSTPSDRVERAGITYLVVGENLAFAPDVYIAHQGLMNSPGHKANILHTDFGHVGIGVIDGGTYGRMFVQVFKD